MKKWNVIYDCGMGVQITCLAYGVNEDEARDIALRDLIYRFPQFANFLFAGVRVEVWK